MISLPAEPHETSAGRALLKPVVKLFDVGVVSIMYHVAFEATSLGDLVRYHAIKVDGIELHTLAERLCARVVADLKSALVKPDTDRFPAEAYTIFCLEKVEREASGGIPAWAAARRREIAALLNEESKIDRLSEQQVDETFRHSLSYTAGDLAVMDWDAALVVDEEGYFDDVLYVIELANLQLEEFRLFDDRLDRFFQRSYGDLDRYSRPGRLLFAPRHVLRALRAIRMDMTKMSEGVGNITKFLGDWYLARVYMACKDRFHLRKWEASVDEKLRQLDNLYSLVHDEISARRMLVLEVIIVALFLVDVIALLWRR
jgi:hypothetical protein